MYMSWIKYLMGSLDWHIDWCISWYVGRYSIDTWLIHPSAFDRELTSWQPNKYIGWTSTYDVGQFIHHNWRLLSQLLVSYIYTLSKVFMKYWWIVIVPLTLLADIYNGHYINRVSTMTLAATHSSIGPILVEFRSSNDQHIVTLQYIRQYVNWGSP